MCNVSGIAFGEAVLTKEMIAGHDVLEVGSLDVNGSLRPYVESLGPARYIGVDIALGPRVDEVVDASKLVDRFGPDAFDVVITTEMVEHIRDWRTVVHNLKGVVRPGGLLLVTTRSIGFPYHGFPYDFWRYEPEDMRAIFADFEMVALERDSASPGVFVLARKPALYKERDAPIALYSIVAKRRRKQISDLDILLFRVSRSVPTGTRPAVRRAAKGAGRQLRRAQRTVRQRVVSPAWRRLPPTVRSRVKRVLGRR
jgi:SAM-dependent methyltransferase